MNRAPDDYSAGVTLSNEPILLFLHGVGTGDRDDLWKARLSETLSGIGYPSLDGVEVIAPKYAHALKDYDDKQDVPPITIKSPSRDAARKNRRDFERRIGAVEFRLGRHNSGNGTIGGDALVNVAVNFPLLFRQARMYLNEPNVRAHVLNKILEALPSSGRIVIVAHSLGSVIAADLVRRLPVDIEIVGMVTIGSPLANGNFEVDRLREAMSEPPANLGWWVNCWNAHDPVAASRGASSVFTWLVDLRVTSLPTVHAHDATYYLANETVAEAIGYGIFGSRSKELARAETAVDVPLDPAETYAVLALRYADLISATLDGDLRDRYRGAMRQVQATVVDSIIRRNEVVQRSTPSIVARLAFDFSDPDAEVPPTAPSSHLPKDEAAVLLAVLASENIIRPFDIAVPKGKREAAMQELTAEMGLSSRFGEDVFVASREAQEVLSGPRSMNLVKIGILGAGATALVVATGGLALAAGAGLAGAAAVTSALAAFGPGGMIGGLLTAGTLMTAGGGSIAYSLASLGTGAEALEVFAERQLTLVILRQRQALDQDHSAWQNFSETETQVRREYERLDEFSDGSSASLKDLKKKIVTLERALAYLRENGFEPGKVSF
ncbi:alpha/beta hydrolase family protein [Microbacterium galbinum]|uniref:hypothetical protein n=1 Tax=Microbacterium galbinum TaxID=2851646 RepID=UPI002000FB40|nr:hypothetical protein [Microbacterium galbinum]